MKDERCNQGDIYVAEEAHFQNDLINCSTVRLDYCLVGWLNIHPNNVYSWVCLKLKNSSEYVVK